MRSLIFAEFKELSTVDRYILHVRQRLVCSLSWSSKWLLNLVRWSRPFAICLSQLEHLGKQVRPSFSSQGILVR
jgi:hypothetical protein